MSRTGSASIGNGTRRADSQGRHQEKRDKQYEAGFAAGARFERERVADRITDKHKLTALAEWVRRGCQ